MAINYQVGDIVIPADESSKWIKAVVVDITEKHLVLQYLEFPEKGKLYYKLNEMHMWKKDITGTLLYGNKSKQHSKSKRNR